MFYGENCRFKMLLIFLLNSMQKWLAALFSQWTCYSISQEHQLVERALCR